MDIKTVREIFLNARDMVVELKKSGENKEYALSITRGPRGEFKPFYLSKPFTRDVPYGVKMTRSILQSFRVQAEESLRNSGKGVSRYIHSWSVLNAALIARIALDLASQLVARTYEYEIPPPNPRSKPKHLRL